MDADLEMPENFPDVFREAWRTAAGGMTPERRAEQVDNFLERVRMNPRYIVVVERDLEATHSDGGASIVGVFSDLREAVEAVLREKGADVFDPESPDVAVSEDNPNVHRFRNQQAGYEWVFATMPVNVTIWDWWCAWAADDRSVVQPMVRAAR